MKTLKSLLAGITLLFVCVAVNAKPANLKETKDDVIKTYIDDITKGKISDLNTIFDDDLEFDMQRGDNVNTWNKGQLLDYLKNNATADPSVKTTTTVTQDGDEASVVKVEFKYDSYTRIDTINLAHTDGWKIIKIKSEFK
jgi:hypothetical protein